jgi:hypothetical protein
MEKREIEELASMAQALQEIDRQHTDLDGITMKQLGDLCQRHSLSMVQIMALISLVRWGRMFNTLKDMSRQAQESPPLRDLDVEKPKDEGIVDFFEQERREKHRIEFL